ncbi:MAG: FtsX-like permease family protein, partial [Eubacteriales bacterium]
MLESLASYLRRNVTLAVKSVMFHKRQYLSFFIALFVIQSLFGVLTIATDNAIDMEDRMLAEEYDYDIALIDLNADQFSILYNQSNTVFISDRVYEIVRYQNRDGEGAYNAKYDVYIRWTNDDADACFARFRKNYYSDLTLLSEGGFRVMQPQPSTAMVVRAQYMITAVAVCALSVFFLMSLYSIRINHYRFTYGVYMSFGADFKKLFENSLWEMMVITFISFVPASLFSVFTDMLIYKSSGEQFVFNWTSLVKLLLFAAAAAALAVIWPVWRLSRRTPMSLIISEDNSNLIVSPRRSFEFGGLKFPSGYETRSMWRFRKYNVKLLLTSTVFAALFISLMFYTDVYQIYREREQFGLTFSDSSFYDEFTSSEIMAIDGVTGTFKKCSSDCTEIRSHIELDSSAAKPFSNFAQVPSSDKLAVNGVSYTACDAEVIEYIKRQGYDYDGDLEAVLTDDRAVIMFDSIDNNTVLNIKVGDTVTAAKYRSRSVAAPDYSQGLELLNFELSKYKFDYIDFTVCAVIHDHDTYPTMPFYISNAAYTDITDAEVGYNIVRVYCDQTLDSAGVRTLYDELRVWAAKYSDSIKVSDTHALVSRRITEAARYAAIYVAAAYLILCLSPLIWFFSQTLFYLKREGEFTVLSAFGALWSEIRRVYTRNGVMFAAAGSVVCAAMNYLAAFAVYKVYNNIL